MGASEAALGNKGLAKEFIVTTKAPTGPGNGAGKRENIIRAANESWKGLKVEKVSRTDVNQVICTNPYP